MTLSEDGCLQQLDLRYNINTKINDILSTITTFGSVSIETSPPSTSVVIKTTKATQAKDNELIVVTIVHKYHFIIRTNHASFYTNVIERYTNDEGI
jgi:hypothetical protein